jgi:GT2 family glycosyltransferase
VLDISVVIPAYNAGQTIKGAIHSVLRQEPVEVIVVDDGSQDDTAEVVQHLSSSSSTVRLISLERREISCRARVRNAGAAVATGKHVLFLDSAWEAEQGLMQAAVDCLDGGTALLVPFRAHGAKVIDGREPSLDPRWPYFAATRGDLMKLACPWLLGWTGALFVPRDALERVGGFDEDFVGWGAEDVDLSLRLFRAGTRFRALTSHHAYRVSSPKGGEERAAQLLANIQRLHRKHGCLETEILNDVGQLHATSLVERLEQLPLGYLVQEYEDEALSALQRSIPGEDPSLLIGAPLWLAGAVPTTHVLAHSTVACQALKERFREREVLRLMGASLPFRAGTFSAAIASDFIRALPLNLMRSVLVELTRVATRRFSVCTTRDTPHSTAIGRLAFREAAGWDLCSPDVLHRVAASAGISLTTVYRSHYTTVLELHSSDAKKGS